MTSLQHVSAAIEEYCVVSILSTDQHVDNTGSRIKRDNEDTKKMLEWLEQHPPFTDTSDLIFISRGVVGNKKINCHLSKEVGVEGMTRMIGGDFKTMKLKRSDRVLPLTTMNSTIQYEDRQVLINPTTLFQRISLIKQSEEELQQFLTHELSPCPLALFDENGMRKGKKSYLYKVFYPLPDTIELYNINNQYVIDGGFLLHRVVWATGHTFENLCKAIRILLL